MIGGAFSASLSANPMFAAQLARLPQDIQLGLQPMFASYDQRVAELQAKLARGQGDLAAAQTELKGLQSSVREVVGENDELRRELQDVTQKLLHESTKAPSSPAHSGGMSDGARQESETLAQLIRSENNVLMAQRRSLAEEAQALKVAREQLESQLLQTQDELTATKEKCQDAQERAQESASEHSRAELELRTCTGRLDLQEKELQETRSELADAKAGLRNAKRDLEEGRQALEELQTRTQLDRANASSNSDQVQRLDTALHEMTEKWRMRGQTKPCTTDIDLHFRCAHWY